MQTEPHIKLKFSVPPPVMKSKELVDEVGSKKAVEAMSDLLDLFRYSPPNLCQHLEDWGEIVHPPGELYYILKPRRKIPPSTFSQWMSGKRRMPTWRVAQAYVLIELYGLEVERTAKQMGLADTHHVWRRLEAAAQYASLFHDDPDIDRWLNTFRKAMVAWLQSAAHVSEYHADRYDWYKGILRQTPWWKDDEEAQAPAE
jgi:hypothetical protein